MVRMSKKTMISLGVSALALSFMFIGDAHATSGIAKVGDKVGQQISTMNDIVGAAAFVIGLVFGASGLLKFKQHAENPGSAPLTHALGRLIVAGALVSLPSVIGTSFGTLWASGSATTNAVGGSLTSIGGY